MGLVASRFIMICLVLGKKTRRYDDDDDVMWKEGSMERINQKVRGVRG